MEKPIWEGTGLPPADSQHRCKARRAIAFGDRILPITPGVSLEVNSAPPEASDDCSPSPHGNSSLHDSQDAR